ncbi:DUF6653 family protein [Haladaptatus sp. DFWS20]|uniref:DUF6653 family protein n=1 Tax=Haladaptatus sp. DFWS20 TaxID=3403467 RepID=UPI003EBD5DF4
MKTQIGSDSVAELFFWSRHANPWSVWTLVVAYPMLILAIYRRRRLLLVGTLLFVSVNPLLFAPPDDDEAWATRVVLGERVWFERGLLSSPRDSLFVGVTAPIHLFALRAAIKRQPVRTLFGTAVSLVCMFVFFDRMVRLYELRPKNC